MKNSHAYKMSMSALFAALGTPLLMEFSRQECWNGLTFPSLGDLRDLGIKPGSSAVHAVSLPSEHQRSSIALLISLKCVPVTLEY